MPPSMRLPNRVGLSYNSQEVNIIQPAVTYYKSAPTPVGQGLLTSLSWVDPPNCASTPARRRSSL